MQRGGGGSLAVQEPTDAFAVLCVVLYCCNNSRICCAVFGSLLLEHAGPSVPHIKLASHAAQQSSTAGTAMHRSALQQQRHVFLSCQGCPDNQFELGLLVVVVGGVTVGNFTALAALLLDAAGRPKGQTHVLWIPAVKPGWFHAPPPPPPPPHHTSHTHTEVPRRRQAPPSHLAEHSCPPPLPPSPPPLFPAQRSLGKGKQPPSGSSTQQPPLTHTSHTSHCCLTI